MVKSPLLDLRFRPVIGGLLSYIPRLYNFWDNSRPTGRNFNSEYSKKIWKIHLNKYKTFANSNTPNIIAELGLGASLGTLISAIKDNVKIAVGLDAVPYATDYKLNKKLLDEIVPENKSPELNLKLSQNISDISASHNDNPIRYIAPWTEAKLNNELSFDFIFSHSVLEHIINPELVYKSLYKLLKRGGIMSHKIDHSSHGITKSWNGHYFLNQKLWKIICGKEPYLLNRLTPQEHKSIILNCGFKIIDENYKKVTSKDNTIFSANDNHLIKTSFFVLEK